MTFYLKGVHVPHRKNTSRAKPVIMPPSDTLTFPMSMHIGAPAEPAVNKGDDVFVGTLIGKASSFVSSNIYSSVSGKVEAVGEVLLSNGRKCAAVTVKSDGNNTPDPSIVPPDIKTREDFVTALSNSGIVGLGGAGFPTHVKFKTDKKIDFLVINLAECEPYITSDSVTFSEKSDYVLLAVEKILSLFDIESVIFGIEKNKPEAIEIAKTLAAKNSKIKVKPLPEIYPQGGEKVIVYHTTGRVVPFGKLPIDVGCVVCNSTTLASIGEFLETGMPLVKKCVTVDGSAVKEPKNIIVPIGTRLSDVFEFAGGFVKEPKKVLYGGPMMGISVPNLDEVILKNTNAVLAFAENDAVLKKPTACIKCGSCINSCPFGLNPQALEKAYNRKDTEALEKLSVGLCMECGCCSFICPASRPLVETNRLSKALLASKKQREAK